MKRKRAWAGLGSSDVAKDRLQQVLQGEKAPLRPEIMELLEHDIQHVVANYMEQSPQDVRLVVDVKGTESSCECALSLAEGSCPK